MLYNPAQDKIRRHSRAEQSPQASWTNYRAIGWAQRQHVGNSSAKHLLVTIASHADLRTGECWQSQETLADETELTTRTIRDKLTFLADLGRITVPEQTRNARGQYVALLVTLQGLDEAATGSDEPSENPCSRGRRRRKSVQPTGATRRRSTQPPSKIYCGTVGNLCNTYRRRD